MRVVKMVWRADRDIIDLLATPPQFVDVPIEPLELGEEMRIRKMAVKNADRVVRIVSDLEIAPDGTDCLHMARCDIARSPDQRKGRHDDSHPRIKLLFQATAVQV